MMTIDYNNIMNIQQYVTTEMLLSLVVVGTMALVYLLFRLTGRMHNTAHNDAETDDYTPRVNSGQLWYQRTGTNQPFLNKEVDPIKILEWRADSYEVNWGWVRCEIEGEEHIKSVEWLVEGHMQDDFNDIVHKSFVKPKPELDIEIEFEKEESKPTGNILTLDGKDYVLAPV